MNVIEVMKFLGKTFAEGLTDEIVSFLENDCEFNIDDSCRYSYEVVKLRQLMKENKTINDLNTSEGTHVSEHGLILFSYGDVKPVAVVYVMLDDKTEVIKSMILSHNRELFDVDFQVEELDILPNSLNGGETSSKEGKDDSELQLCNEIVYEDSNFRISRLWRWKVKELYEDEETGLFKVLISGQAFNFDGKSTYVSPDGKRRANFRFDYLGNFHEGMAKVAMFEQGYGFIDRDMNLTIPMKYDIAEDFKDGRAKVYYNYNWYSIDKAGKETLVSPSRLIDRYQEVGDFSEGLCKVSILKLGQEDLAYHSDNGVIAGIWGYVNEEGQEVIPPQYIYAYNFLNGIAVVCKGKWTIDKKWDNEYNRGGYWTEEEWWGAIDSSGKEVIAFKFDAIEFFDEAEEVFMAHYGGWETGHWGVIDKSGNWLVEPIFEDIDYGFWDGLFAFYSKDKWSDPGGVPMGIYDMKQKKIIFEPQFYEVYFLDDGYIEVEVFDAERGQRVVKVVDREGNERVEASREGKEVLPAMYNKICWGKDNRLICQVGERFEVLQFEYK